jgi:N-acetylglucosamine-6-sulfatase
MNSEHTRLSRRELLKAAGAASVALGPIKSYAQSEVSLKKIADSKPRNVVFILSDDHRYDFMSFLGRPKFLETPNMDRLAAEGAHLPYAYVTTALCSPSRASILTGQYSHRHGVVDNNSLIPEGTRFFPQYLQQIGYQTAFIGKWHMGRQRDSARPGFDKWVSFRGQGQYYNCRLNVNGRQVTAKKHISDELTDYAVNWLKNERDKSKPFFLYLSHKAVHAMFEPAKRHLGKYENVTLEYPRSMADTEENYKGRPRWVKEQRNSWHGVDYMYHGRMDFDTFYKRYCETLLSIDESIGSLMQCLEEMGIADSTLVLYMGDNGFSFGEHGLIDKRHGYEESMRVPLLARCPEIIKPGTKVEQLVQNIDIAPTILQAAGLQTPGDMDGRSFLPLLESGKIPWRDEIFYEYYWERNFPQTPTVHAVRTERYKYLHYHGIWDTDELYDLKNDPEEMVNLINEPQHKKLIEELNKKLFNWLEETDGMKIPLRPDAGSQSNQRGPKKVSTFNFFEETK